MNRIKRMGTVLLACACMAGSVGTVAERMAITAEAHSGRKDANEGHRDNKNKSGLGPYHYHCGGSPAHLHDGGVCPYNSAVGRSGGSGTSSSQARGHHREHAAAASQSAATDELSAYVAVFDADYYYDTYEDLQSAVGRDEQALFRHFTEHGMTEGRRGCADFDVNTYRANNADLEAAFGGDLPRYYHHYMESGCHEGRVH